MPTRSVNESRELLRRKPRRVLVPFITIATTFFLFAPIALAGVIIENEMATEFLTNDSGVAIYPYGSGQQHVADFGAGTYNGTVDNGGALELGGRSDDWWDIGWQQRQCFDFSSTDALAEYPIRFEVDTSGSSSDGDDIRVVVEGTNTVLESYSEGPFPSAASVVWAQAEPLPAGVSSYCIYFDNASAPSVSNEVDVFTYTSGQTIKYYTMLDTYRANGVDSRVTVVSYSANNTVSDGSTTVTLQAGDFHTFSGLDEDSIVTATGPISASYDRPSKEALLPESFADSQFTFPTRRYAERFWIRSPHATTTVEAIINGSAVGSVTVGPGSGSVQLIAPGVGAQFVSLRSTDGTNFLAVHSGTNDQDTMLGVPWFGDTLYGVPSTVFNLGALTNSTVSWFASDGSANPNQAVSMNTLTALGGNGSYGSGPAYGVSGSSYFHAAQQADSDGTEVTSFLPQRLLSETYRLPVASRYYTIACPVVGTTVEINGTSTGTCAGTGVGHFYSGFGSHAAGTLIEADNPIYVYYEGLTSRDEHNVFGAKASIPYLEDQKQQARPVEKVPVQCGTWESAVLPTAGVFGLFDVAATIPTGASATYQLSTDGSAFYGPDGTAATSFAAGDIVPYLADDAATVQFRVELCAGADGSSPSVSSLMVECDLVEATSSVGGANVLSVGSVATPTTTPLLRVYQRTAGSWLASVEFVDGANLAATDVVFTTDTPTTQVAINSGAVSATPTPFAHTTATPYSLFAQHETIAGQQSRVDLVLVDEAAVRIEKNIEANFVG